MIVGGGVAGYVAAIKAGQEGLKVWTTTTRTEDLRSATDGAYCRLHA